MELILILIIVGWTLSSFQSEQERKALLKKHQEMTQFHAYDVLL